MPVREFFAKKAINYVVNHVNESISNQPEKSFSVSQAFDAGLRNVAQPRKEGFITDEEMTKSRSDFADYRCADLEGSGPNYWRVGHSAADSRMPDTSYHR